MTELIRPAAVAGAFYPGSAAELRGVVERLLGAAPAPDPRRAKAIVVPHAGYVYSGPVAAAGFARLFAHGRELERVVLLGPAHRVPLDGLATPGATRLRTPLGDVEVDREALARVPDVPESPRAHAREHSLEVELPFLQVVAPRARVAPFVVGHAPPEAVARVIDALWGGPETVVVVSSDLSHYLPYDEGREVDTDTARRILSLDRRALVGEEACGCAGINGLLRVARARGLRAELASLASSGDTAGPRDEVVGYGAFAFYEGAA